MWCSCIIFPNKLFKVTISCRTYLKIPKYLKYQVIKVLVWCDMLHFIKALSSGEVPCRPWRI